MASLVHKFVPIVMEAGSQLLWRWIAECGASLLLLPQSSFLCLLPLLVGDTEIDSVRAVDAHVSLDLVENFDANLGVHPVVCKTPGPTIRFSAAGMRRIHRRIRRQILIGAMPAATRPPVALAS